MITFLHATLITQNPSPSLWHTNQSISTANKSLQISSNTARWSWFSHCPIHYGRLLVLIRCTAKPRSHNGRMNFITYSKIFVNNMRVLTHILRTKLVYNIWSTIILCFSIRLKPLFINLITLGCSMVLGPPTVSK